MMVFMMMVAVFWSGPWWFVNLRGFDRSISPPPIPSPPHVLWFRPHIARGAQKWIKSAERGHERSRLDHKVRSRWLWYGGLGEPATACSKGVDIRY